MGDEEDEEKEDERLRRERIPAAFLPTQRARAPGPAPGTAAIDAFASEYLLGLQCEQNLEAPPFWENENGKDNGPDASKSLAYKGQLCKGFLMGICQKGDQCFDAHGDSELQTLRSAAGEGFFEMSAAMREMNRPQANPALLELMRFVQQPASELAEEALRKQAGGAPEAESPGAVKRRAPSHTLDGAQPSDSPAGEQTGAAKRARASESQPAAVVDGSPGAAGAPHAAPSAEAAPPAPGGDMASMAAALGVSETNLLEMGYGGPNKVAQAQATLLSAAHMAGYGNMAPVHSQGAADSSADAGFGDYYAQVLASHGGAMPNVAGVGPQHMQQQLDQSRYKYKTVLCKFFPLGQCTKGERCTFAHFPQETGFGPPLGNGGVQAASPSDWHRQMQSAAAAAANPSAAAYAAAMQAAVMHQSMGPMSGPMPQPVVVRPPGVQSAGPVVVPPPGQYAAVAGTQEPSMEAWSQSEAWSQAAAVAAAAAMASGQQQAMGEPLRTRGFKTQLCRFFPMGQCTRAVGCTYAHGDEELRTYGNAAAAARRGATPTMTSFAEGLMPAGLAADNFSTFTF